MNTEVIERTPSLPHSMNNDAMGVYSTTELVAAFAHGIIEADMWWPMYQVPPHFEDFLNYVAKQLSQFQDSIGQLYTNPADIQAFFTKLISEHEIGKVWNLWGGLGEGDLVFTSSFDAPHKERSMIDLDAAVRNAIITLRSQRREH